MSELSTASYWPDTAPPFQSAAPGPVEGRAEVAIIGAGFTGLSAALTLRKRGASVMVLEADLVPGPDSGRNGGQCNSGLAHDYGSLSRFIGRQRAMSLGRTYCDRVGCVETVRVATLGASEHAAANPWRDLAWSSVPGHFGKPWFLPLVDVNYREQDLIH